MLMPTYDDLFLIENRAEPRRRMLYITPPYTPMLMDINLIGAEMAVATQKRMLQVEQNIASALNIQIRHLGRKDSPEITNGVIFNYNT